MFPICLQFAHPTPGYDVRRLRANRLFISWILYLKHHNILGQYGTCTFEPTRCKQCNTMMKTHINSILWNLILPRVKLFPSEWWHGHGQPHRTQVLSHMMVLTKQDPQILIRKVWIPRSANIGQITYHSAPQNTMAMSTLRRAMEHAENHWAPATFCIGCMGAAKMVWAWQFCMPGAGGRNAITAAQLITAGFANKRSSYMNELDGK